MGSDEAYPTTTRTGSYPFAVAGYSLEILKIMVSGTQQVNERTITEAVELAKHLLEEAGK